MTLGLTHKSKHSIFVIQMFLSHILLHSEHLYTLGLHTHKSFKHAPSTDWFRHAQAHIISRRRSNTDGIFSRTHCHLYAQIFHTHTHTQWEAVVYRHTHAVRALLRCSIRLSMALILICSEGKSLLGAVGAGGESIAFSRYTLQHKETARYCWWAVCERLISAELCHYSYLMFDIIQSCAERSTHVPVDSWRKQTFHESEHRQASSQLRV